MRVDHLEPGRPAPAGLVGAVLTRDLVVAGVRWVKGRRLSADDVAAFAGEPGGRAVTVLVADAGDVHEDEAALPLAPAPRGGYNAPPYAALSGPQH